MALRAKNEAFNVEMATQHADVSAVTLSVSSDPQEQQRKQQSAHSLLASHPGLVISSQNSVENPTVSVSLVDSTDSSHERHMKQFVHNMLESRRSSVVSDEKYEKILSYLRDPDNTKLSPQFKFWVTKERQMSLTHQEENGETREVLTCCVPDCKKEHKQFDGISTLTIIPERDLYRTVKEIHEERLNHSGYKKVMDYQGKPVSQPMQELVEQASQALEVELDAIKQELQLQEGDVFHWAQYLPRVMFKLNSQKPSPTMDTPYGVVFRQQPKTTLLPGLGSRIIGESQLERLIVSLTGTQS
ncbi:hypothetical protein BaRGS_00001955 [Batillaria attramentaria]|uniref:Uncharacterized protein n=1 Tax=Batillaria attramentaria TaxID=370345 RepID=A0ABD0M5S8_9CAEN